MIKKRFTAIISLALLLAALFPAGAYAATYNDTEGHWACEAIENWSSFGIIQGNNGSFRPDDSITRGEMAAIIQRLMEYTVTADNNIFTDLDPSAWYTEYVLKMNAAGVMLGDGAGHANPLASITRQEALVMIARALGMDSWSSSGVLPFADAGDISPWAVQIITAMNDRSYLDWAGNSIRPRQAITRAEVIATLDNAVKKIWTEDGLFCTQVDGNALVKAGNVYLLNSNINGNIIISGKGSDVIVEHCQVNGNIVNPCGVRTTVLEDNNGELGYFYYGSYTIPTLFEVDHNRYMAGYFQNSAGRKIYTDNSVRTRAGIDVSQWQNDIDWQSVANDGIEFAIIRLGYRGYEAGGTNIDTKFFQNMEGAIANGLDVGVYFFSQAISVEEAVEEAQICIDYLRGYDLDYPVVFDWETVGSAQARTNNMDGDLLTECAIAFCETIEDAGYEAMVYSNKSLALRTLKLERLSDYGFWFAGYTTYPEFYYDFDIWQYTSGGSVAGIEGRVDMNIHFLD